MKELNGSQLIIKKQLDKTVSAIEGLQGEITKLNAIRELEIEMRKEEVRRVIQQQKETTKRIGIIVGAIAGILTSIGFLIGVIIK